MTYLLTSPDQPYCAGSMAPAATLVGVLEVPGLAACVLGLLPLRALAALECACTSLRVVVATQPEALWQARRLQVLHLHPLSVVAEHSGSWMQAAVRQDPTADRMLLYMSSIRTHLRRQHSAEASICRGAPARPVNQFQLSLPRDTCIGTDFTRVALLADGKLCVRTIWGAHLCCWSLSPEEQASIRPARAWAWDPAGKTVCVPFATACPALGNVMFWDSYSGEVFNAHLRLEEHVPGHVEVHSCPTRPLVLVQRATLDGRLALTVLNFFGTNIATLEIDLRSQKRLQCTWASWGHTAVFQALATLHQCPCSALYRWETNTLHQGHASIEVAWSTPSSRPVARAMKWPWSQHLEITAAEGCFELDLPSTPGCWVWGSRLVVLSPAKSSVLHGSAQLQVFAVPEGASGTVVLAPQRTFAAKETLFVPGVLELAPSGQLCALLTGTPAAWGGRLRKRCLGLLHLTSCKLRQYTLKNFHLADLLDGDKLQVRWSPDSSAVLVSSKDGGHSELFWYPMK